MAIWILSFKALLISTAVLFTALIFNLSFPLLREFLSLVLPQIWYSLLSWLTPPYLYFVINGIIISIAASSKFQQEKVEEDPDTDPMKNPEGIRLDFEVVLKSQAEIGSDFLVLEESRVSETKETLGLEEKEEEEEEENFVISRSDWEPKRRDSTEYSRAMTEKPLVSVRFGHRKTVKASPEGNRALGVARPKRHETLESTWKTITKGRPMPLNRHLKKSDTWDTHGRVRSDGQDPVRVMKKSETVKERRTSQSPGSGKLLRKESSLSQDELNRRVEAFITKFKEEMRLQRQESIQHYKEMMNRGNH